jgi:hypothetical protein
MTNSGEGRKVDAFRMNTAEVIEQFLTLFEFQDASQVVREMMLLDSVFVSSERLQVPQGQLSFLGDIAASILGEAAFRRTRGQVDHGRFE